MKYYTNPQNNKAMTATPSKYPQGYFKEKPCGICNEQFKPVAPSQLYCSKECRAVANSSSYLKRNYNITVDDYNKLLEDNNHKCHICDGEGFTMAEHHSMKLAVDHCHTTGEVRGLLCHNCNRALGLFQDSVSNLKRAIDYLKGT